MEGFKAMVKIRVELDLHRLGCLTQPLLLVVLLLDFMLLGINLLRQLDAFLQFVQDVQVDRDFRYLGFLCRRQIVSSVVEFGPK